MISIATKKNDEYISGKQKNGLPAGKSGRDEAMFLQREMEALGFLAAFARDVSFSLNRDEVLAAAAKRLFEYFRFSFAVFHLSPENGGVTAYSPLDAIDCRAAFLNVAPLFPELKQKGIYGYRFLGLNAPLEERFSREHRFDIEIPDDGGCIALFCAEEASILSSETIVAGLAGTLATALRNAREHNRVRELSLRDSLTGLYNRRVLEEILHLEESKRKKSPFSVILVDLDNFKVINDTYGHPAGDKVLSAIGRLLLENSRRENIVARYGGEEFALLLTNTDLETARQIAERLRVKVSEEVFTFSGQKVRMTASFGVAHNDVHASGGEGVLARADQALYQAKRSGKNRVCVHEAAQVSRMAERRRPPVARPTGRLLESAFSG